jgi:hypothetical protein
MHTYRLRKYIEAKGRRIQTAETRTRMKTENEEEGERKGERKEKEEGQIQQTN